MTHNPAEPTIAYISDGTSYIFKVETNNWVDGKQEFKVLDSFEVKDNNNTGVKWLNELEWANGYLYANIWQYSRIVKIDVSNGKIVEDYDFSYLARHAQTTALSNFNGFHVDLRNYCLNGIAWMEKDGYQGAEGSFLLTGKKWPTVYQIKFNGKHKKNRNN